MLRFFAPVTVAAGLLVALPALAAGPSSGYDDTTYPAGEATFTSAVDTAPIVTPDVVYQGPHAAFVKVPSRAADAQLLARYDDTIYPSMELAAAPARAPQQAAPQQAPSARVACGCVASR